MIKKRQAKNDIKTGRNSYQLVITTLMILFLFSGCNIYEQAARSAIENAFEAALEEEFSNRFAVYSDVMMYQLAYTQIFYLGGFGFYPENFDEGTGEIWRIEANDSDEQTHFTAERALLHRQADGSSWWYFRFQSEDMNPVEYEVLLSEDLQAREMYIRDPESRDIRYHEFEHDNDELSQMEDGDESMEEMGFQTNYYHMDSWDEFREGTEEITVGAGTFQADILLFSPQEIEDADRDDERFEYQWWVAREVPGQLVKFEYRDQDEGGKMRGELMEVKRDYIPRFADL